MKRKKYTLGNLLRGYVEGNFENLEEAWKWLSRAWLLDIGSKTARYALMFVQETNSYGFVQYISCKKGMSDLNSLPEKEVWELCKRSLFYK